MTAVCMIIDRPNAFDLLFCDVFEICLQGLKLKFGMVLIFYTSVFVFETAKQL